jgi:site-specific DNA recombinase
LPTPAWDSPHNYHPQTRGPTAGRITCAHCNRPYVGASAHGNRYRYRYYTCFSRIRYGSATCTGERLPADQLEQAVIDAILDTYSRTDLFQQAAATICEQANALRGRHQQEFETVATEINRSEDAFERGTLPAEQCKQRIEKLGHRLMELRARRDELGDALMEVQEDAGMPEKEMMDLLQQVRVSLEHGPDTMRRSLVQELVHGLTVVGRHEITPVFRVPQPRDLRRDTQVRIREGSVGLPHPCANPNPQVNGPTIRISGTHAKIRRDGYTGNAKGRG